jgi:hypothetical protein
MYRRSIIGFLRDNFDKVEEMQAKGYFLDGIYEKLKLEHTQPFTFLTFKSAIYLIRQEKGGKANINTKIDEFSKSYVTVKAEKLNNEKQDDAQSIKSIDDIKDMTEENTKKNDFTKGW